MFTIQSNSIQTIKDYINNNIIQLQELNDNGHYIANNDYGDTIQVSFNDYSLFIILTLTGQY